MFTLFFQQNDEADTTTSSPCLNENSSLAIIMPQKELHEEVIFYDI